MVARSPRPSASWESDRSNVPERRDADAERASAEHSPSRVRGLRAYDGKVISLDIDVVRYPDGSFGEVEMVRHPGAAAIVAVSALGEGNPHVILLRQYRYAVDSFLLEIPAGRLEPGETPIECASRELREETGYRAERWEPLLTMYTTPGFTDEKIHLFVASDLTAGQSALERDEFAEVKRVPLTDAIGMIESGDIQDAKTIVGLLLAADRL